MLFLFSLLSFFFAVSGQTFNCSQPETFNDNRINSTQWKLAQFNVEWLFTEPYSSCPGICNWNTSEEEWEHLNTIKSVLDELNADTIHLCEVQSCTQLEQVKPSTLYNSYMVKGNDTYTGQNVGLLTKIDPMHQLVRTEDRYSYPIKDSICGYDETGTEGVTKHLITDFYINGLSIKLIGAHLLSNPNDPEACSKRESQAQVLQKVIQDAINENYEVIMIGDLNDFDENIPDLNNNTPKSKVLDILKGNVGDYANYTLYSVGNMVSQSERYTEWYDANENCIVDKEDFSTLDHMLMTKRLYDSIIDVNYEHIYQQSCNTFQSDHYPVMVTFEFA
jgi:exonuclease III